MPEDKGDIPSNIGEIRKIENIGLDLPTAFGCLISSAAYAGSARYDYLLKLPGQLTDIDPTLIQANRFGLPQDPESLSGVITALSLLQPEFEVPEGQNPEDVISRMVAGGVNTRIALKSLVEHAKNVAMHRHSDMLKPFVIPDPNPIKAFNTILDEANKFRLPDTPDALVRVHKKLHLLSFS